MSFSENLKLIRHNAGLSQEKLAEMLNIARSSISKYENGSQQPSVEIIAAICRNLNVSADYLLDIKRGEIVPAKEQTSGKRTDNRQKYRKTI